MIAASICKEKVFYASLILILMISIYDLISKFWYLSLEKQEMTSDSAKNRLFQLFSCISLNFLHVLVNHWGFANVMRPG